MTAGRFDWNVLATNGLTATRTLAVRMHSSEINLCAKRRTIPGPTGGRTWTVRTARFPRIRPRSMAARDCKCGCWACTTWKVDRVLTSFTEVARASSRLAKTRHRNVTSPGADGPGTPAGDTTSALIPSNPRNRTRSWTKRPIPVTRARGYGEVRTTPTTGPRFRCSDRVAAPFTPCLLAAEMTLWVGQARQQPLRLPSHLESRPSPPRRSPARRL